MIKKEVRIMSGWIIKENRVNKYVLTHNGQATFYKQKPKKLKSWETALKVVLIVSMKK